MPHNVSLISTIAAGFGLALVFGFVAARLKMPPLVGYLLAGMLIGPATPGFVADVELAGQLAEIGVMLLMFGVGLHFSLEDLLAVKRIAVPGALLQIVVATALGMATSLFWGWTLGAALVFGLALSVASTVVLLRALEARGVLESVNGRIAVGWLVVEDLVMVLVLVLLPPLAPLLGGSADAHAGAAGAGALDHARHHAGQGRRVHRADAGRRPARVPAPAVAGGAHRLARAVHAVRGRRRRRRRLRLGEAVRRVVRARRVLRRHDDARVGVQPPRGRRVAAAARRVLGAVLRLGRHAVRPAGAARRAAASVLAVVGDHHGRQDARRDRARARVPLPAEHRADGRREPGADRRVLVHPGRARRRARAAAGGGPEPDPRRRADLDRAELAAVRAIEPAQRVDARALGARAPARAARRPARRAADVDRPVIAGRAGGAGRATAGSGGRIAQALRRRACRTSLPSRTARSSKRLREQGTCRRCRAMRPTRPC